MTPDYIFNKIRSIVADQLGFRVADVYLNSCLSEDLGADSLDEVELVMAIEEEFGIEIPLDDCEGLFTVELICRYISSRLGVPSESITDTLEDQATQVSLEEENVSETNTESLKGIESSYRIQAVVNVEVGVTIRDLTHYLSRDEAYKLYQDLKVIFEEKLI